MRFLILLMLISASVNAGTLTLNGKNCGELSSATWKPDGTLSLVTDGSCGGAVVDPPPVVVQPPSTECPAGVKCVTRPWPTIPREVLGFKAGEVLAIKVQTTLAGKFGRVVTSYTTGDTSARDVALSEKPGDFPANCTAHGIESANLPWQQGGTSAWKCVLTPESTYWINIRPTNCEAGKTCRFYLTGG